MAAAALRRGDWGHVRADELRPAEEKSAVGFIDQGGVDVGAPW